MHFPNSKSPATSWDEWPLQTAVVGTTPTRAYFGARGTLAKHIAQQLKRTHTMPPVSQRDCLFKRLFFLFQPLGQSCDSSTLVPDTYHEVMVAPSWVCAGGLNLAIHRTWFTCWLNTSEVYPDRGRAEYCPVEMLPVLFNWGAGWLPAAKTLFQQVLAGQQEHSVAQLACTLATIAAGILHMSLRF